MKGAMRTWESHLVETGFVSRLFPSEIWLWGAGELDDGRWPVPGCSRVFVQDSAWAKGWHRGIGVVWGSGDREDRESQLARGVRTACYSLSASAVPHQPTMTPLPISPDSPCTLPSSTYLPSRPAHELSPKMSILRNGLKSMHSATPADSADPYTSLEQHHPSPDLRPKYFSGESGSRSVH